MKFHQKTSLLAVACAAFFIAAAPSYSAALSNVDDLREEAVSLAVQQVSHATPAGARCVKWSRRWNPRHGVGHRRCVRWR